MTFTAFGDQIVNAYYTASAGDATWSKTEPSGGYGLDK